MDKPNGQPTLGGEGASRALGGHEDLELKLLPRSLPGLSVLSPGWVACPTAPIWWPESLLPKDGACCLPQA